MDYVKDRDKAWQAFEEFDYLEWYPRFYKKRKGQKLVFINPFTSIAERDELAKRRRDLWIEFLLAQFKVYDAGLSTELTHHWIREDTPDGERWRRIA